MLDPDPDPYQMNTDPEPCWRTYLPNEVREELGTESESKPQGSQSDELSEKIGISLEGILS